MKSLVIGCGFGDEGKGLVTDWITSVRATEKVVRFSGGSQCGHSVRPDANTFHEFSTLGSGSFNGVTTYIGKNVICNPIKLINEIHAFEAVGPRPEVLIHQSATLVAPMDVYENRENKSTLNHGSCGQGVFAAKKRTEAGYLLKAQDLLFPAILRRKYHLIRENCYKNGSSTDTHLKDFMDAAEDLQDYIRIVPAPDVDGDFFNNTVWEGNQGLLLDPHIGFFPHCTPTDILPDATAFDELYLVTRSYHTRHGNGPGLSGENSPGSIVNPYETNRPNAWQGDFKTAHLDMDLLRYAISHVPANMAKKINLVINHLDVEHSTVRENGRPLVFPEKEDFVKRIVDRVRQVIRIDNVFVNDSPLRGKIHR
jgi:adenylosuccinate synthase